MHSTSKITYLEIQIMHLAVENQTLGQWNHTSDNQNHILAWWNHASDDWNHPLACQNHALVCWNHTYSWWNHPLACWNHASSCWNHALDDWNHPPGCWNHLLGWQNHTLACQITCWIAEIIHWVADIKYWMTEITTRLLKSHFGLPKSLFQNQIKDAKFEISLSTITSWSNQKSWISNHYFKLWNQNLDMQDWNHT